MQGIHKGWIALPKHCGQFDGLMNAPRPALGLKCKPSSLAFATDWWQLEKISTEHKLNSTKWGFIASDFPGQELCKIQQIRIDHANFINNKDFRASPSIQCLSLPLYKADDVIDFRVHRTHRYAQECV